MVDATRGEERRVQVIEVTSLAGMRPVAKCGEALRSAQLVEHVEVCVEVVCIVRIMGVAFGPLLGWRRWHVGRRQRPLRFGLVVDGVEADDLLEQQVQLRVRRRVVAHLKKRHEDVVEHLAKRAQQPIGLIHRVQPRHLYEPSVVWRVKLMLDDPFSKLVPLGLVAPVDRQPVLRLLILGEVQVVEEFLCELGEVTAFDHIVRLEKDLTQARLAERVVLEVELVEARKRVRVRVHPQGVDRQVVRREPHLVKDLL
mmetsp:Transcript_24890/g.63392  ORF Transcript_24890/g.63392 Transcript_24890/m.63392 type:complete len:255 (+) Transcript_24890:1386-2150(+)